MSDFNSSLPVRTESAGDVVVQVSDSLIPARRLAINADGSINIADAGGSITVDGEVAVTADNLNIRDLVPSRDKVKLSDGTDDLAINADGSLNVVVTDATPGAPVNDYNTVAVVAGNASSTHTYTALGNFYLQQVAVSASGKLKVEIKVNNITKFVFFTSTANPNINLSIEQPILATVGQTVTITRTNLEMFSNSVYSTISGYEL